MKCIWSLFISVSCPSLCLPWEVKKAVHIPDNTFLPKFLPCHSWGHSCDICSPQDSIPILAVTHSLIHCRLHQLSTQAIRRGPAEMAEIKGYLWKKKEIRDSWCYQKGIRCIFSNLRWNDWDGWNDREENRSSGEKKLSYYLLNMLTSHSLLKFFFFFRYWNSWTASTESPFWLFCHPINLLDFSELKRRDNQSRQLGDFELVGKSCSLLGILEYFQFYRLEKRNEFLIVISFSWMPGTIPWACLWYRKDAAATMNDKRHCLSHQFLGESLLNSMVWAYIKFNTS